EAAGLLRGWKRLSCPFPVLNRVGLAWWLRSHATGADLNVASILASGKMGTLGSIVPFERSAMARQLFGATCLRPRARSDKAQVSAHPDFAIELTVTSHLQKLRSASCTYCNIGFRFWNFLVIRDRGVRPD